MNSMILDQTIERKFRSHEELTVKEKVVLGDYWLNDKTTYADKLYLSELPLTILYSHPFGLEPLMKNGHLQFLGKDGKTDISVAAMREWLKHSRRFVNKLRIIYAESEHEPQHHFVYFEASSFVAVLCGGCTDFSGGGDYGRQQLEAMFFCIAEELKLHIETVTVPFYIYENGKKNLPC